VQVQLPHFPEYEMTLHIRCPPLTIFSYEENTYTERMQLLHSYRDIPHFQMMNCRKISSYTNIRENAVHYFYIQLFYVFFFFMLSKFCKRKKNTCSLKKATVKFSPWKPLRQRGEQRCSSSGS
jgi:hypothetical protein